MIAEAIHCAAFDEIFHRTLIQLITHTLDEILRRFERAVLDTVSRHRTDQSPSHILYCAHTKSDTVPFYRKLVLGVVNIRG